MEAQPAAPESRVGARWRVTPASTEDGAHPQNGEHIPLAQAAAMGLIQGPTELLPVSSSAHLALIPWLARWRWEGLDPSLRKAFDVAVHGGTALALLIGQRRLIQQELESFDLRRAGVLALSFVPAALVGYAFERPIERALGGPATTALGLIVGGGAMAAADRAPQERGRGDANALDGLALGVAQAAALAPGISRNGATLTAARLRRFDRQRANLLSRTVALPVIVGAALLKGSRMWRSPAAKGNGAAVAIGTAASFASTLASQRLIGLVEADRALWPYAAYRVGLGLATLATLARRRFADPAWVAKREAGVRAAAAGNGHVVPESIGGERSR